MGGPSSFVKIVSPGSGEYGSAPMRLPCGKCRGCRVDYASDWAQRCYHESLMHDENCFLTLTYSPEFLPAYGCLSKKDFQGFMKRLRSKIAPVKVRYFHSGEYGDESFRPHYHCLLFGYDFPDKYFWRRSDDGDRIFRSEELEKLWPFGHSEVGSVTYRSAGYVARYVWKKRYGSEGDERYLRLANAETGEMILVDREYATMSRRPGIGRRYYDAYKSDMFPSDFVVIEGKRQKPAGYYFDLWKIEDPEGAAEVERRRQEYADEHAADGTPARLKVREKCLELRTDRLERSL